MDDPSVARTGAIDLDEYAAELVNQTRRGECFVCDLIADPTGRHVVYEDDLCIVFLPRHLTMEGRVLVAPRRHATEVVDDFHEDDYVELQRRVYRVGRAITSVFDSERLYIFSFGAKEGAAHVHWHIAALPPGVPYLRQQFHSVMIENGHLELTDTDQEAIANRIRSALR